MAKLILQIATVSALQKATEKIGLLPIDAEEGDKVIVTEADVQRLERNNNIGAIKGLLFAGGGRIHDSYTCAMPASHKDARKITFQKNGVDQELAVPTWKPTKGSTAFDIEQVGAQPIAAPTPQPAAVPIP